jgi:hypothetical protein
MPQVPLTPKQVEPTTARQRRKKPREAMQQMLPEAAAGGSAAEHTRAPAVAMPTAAIVSQPAQRVGKSRQDGKRQECNKQKGPQPARSVRKGLAASLDFCRTSCWYNAAHRLA